MSAASIEDLGDNFTQELENAKSDREIYNEKLLDLTLRANTISDYLNYLAQEFSPQISDSGLSAMFMDTQKVVQSLREEIFDNFPPDKYLPNKIHDLTLKGERLLADAITVIEKIRSPKNSSGTSHFPLESDSNSIDKKEFIKRINNTLYVLSDNFSTMTRLINEYNYNLKPENMSPARNELLEIQLKFTKFRSQLRDAVLGNLTLEQSNELFRKISSEILAARSVIERATKETNKLRDEQKSKRNGMTGTQKK